MDPIYHYLESRDFQPKGQTNLNAIYDNALPRFLDMFDQYNVKATFFIVGKDATNTNNRNRIREILGCGHEIANHTFNHLQYFKNLRKDEKKKEIEKADKILSDITGEKISGFRAPGWRLDKTTIDILEENDYHYDSSVFSSKIFSVICLINWLLNRGRLKGTIGSSIVLSGSPKVPYRPDNNKIWKMGKAKILEMPPTILPIIQLPFLGTLLYMFGKNIFNFSFFYFRLFNQPLLYVLHGIELVDYYTALNDKRLLMKPGLGKTIDEKLELYHLMLSKFSKHCQFITMKELSDFYWREGK